MERMREDPAPPAWRAESSSATAGDGSQRAESAPRIPGRSPARQDLAQEFENFPGDAEDTQTSVLGRVRSGGSVVSVSEARLYAREKIELR